MADRGGGLLFMGEPYTPLFELLSQAQEAQEAQEVVSPLFTNECKHDGCSEWINDDGLMCDYHWQYVPETIKEQYRTSIDQAKLAVRAAEMLRRPSPRRDDA